jgi:hypothetical protein
MTYAKSTYLIYVCFETKRTEQESTIAGSLLLDHANTIDEANEKITMYKERSNECDKQYNFCSNYALNTRRYVSIENKSYWWKDDNV